MNITKPLNPTPFHYGMRFAHGKRQQIMKVIEELKELSLAIDEGDVDHITEELADVEIVIPYIECIFHLGSRPTVRVAKFKYNYKIMSNILCDMLELRLDHGISRFDDAIKITLEHLAFSLYYIYNDYNITLEDVDRWKDEKYRRTIKRTVQKIIGG